MSVRKLNMFEKMANMAGVIYRYHAREAPRRFKILMDVARKELAPPKPSEWKAIKKDFAAVLNVIHTKAYKEYSVRELAVYVAVGLEIVFFFFVGEMIGRRNMVGYIVPATYVSKSTRQKVKELEREKLTTSH